MMQSNFEEADLQRLIVEYRDSAVAHGKASFNGDYKTANRNADAVMNICRELRRRGREAQNSLLPLLNDEDLNVRVWAAAHALEFAPTEAEPVLVELSKLGVGLHRLDAEVFRPDVRHSETIPITLTLSPNGKPQSLDNYVNGRYPSGERLSE